MCSPLFTIHFLSLQLITLYVFFQGFTIDVCFSTVYMSNCLHEYYFIIKNSITSRRSEHFKLVFFLNDIVFFKNNTFFYNISDSVDEKITCQAKVATLVQRCPCNSEDQKTQCGLQYKKLFHNLKPCNIIVWINL